MTWHLNPRELIEDCLKPLGLNEQSPAAQEAVRRLPDALRSVQTRAGRGGVSSPELSKTPAIVINEAAHGYDA